MQNGNGFWVFPGESPLLPLILKDAPGTEAEDPEQRLPASDSLLWWRILELRLWVVDTWLNFLPTNCLKALTPCFQQQSPLGAWYPHLTCPSSRKLAPPHHCGP